MSAFFAGYVILQVPAGYLSDRYGGKWVLGLGVLFWSMFTVLTPLAALLGISTLLACRFLLGIAEAVTWPSIYSLYSRWVHPDRRASAVGLMNSDSRRRCHRVGYALAHQRLVWQGAFIFTVYWDLSGLGIGRFGRDQDP